MATVIPYTGYGSTSWIRVLGRVVLDRPAAADAGEAAGARGWRNFTKIPVKDAEVEVQVGGRTAVVTADNSGIVDAVVAVDLFLGIVLIAAGGALFACGQDLVDLILG